MILPESQVFCPKIFATGGTAAPPPAPPPRTYAYENKEPSLRSCQTVVNEGEADLALLDFKRSTQLYIKSFEQNPPKPREFL